MKFASLNDGSLDGSLLLVSRDLARCLDASSVAPNLLTLVEKWDALMPALSTMYEEFDRAGATAGSPFDPADCCAPLPRSPQWCDGSAFLNHAKLMERAFNTPPIPDLERIPLMYQGASDDFLGPHAPVVLPSEADGIDFEGEFGVVLGAVPMAVAREDALRHVRLLVQLNDWSLRALGPREMATGFGFLQAKPSTSFAPVAVTPDELGEAWRDARVHLRLHVEWNGAWFGQPHGGEMSFGFDQLIAHAARTRRLAAGAIIGTGTVSNAAGEAGSACIAERRVLEIIAHGAPVTAFMRFGDRVRMQARWPDGRDGPFGVIDQVVADPQVAP
jgi:fumarylacetoacetate (FAA) hydrolase